jgi:hypothetical protein
MEFQHSKAGYELAADGELRRQQHRSLTTSNQYNYAQFWGSARTLQTVNAAGRGTLAPRPVARPSRIKTSGAYVSAESAAGTYFAEFTVDDGGTATYEALFLSTQKG